MWAKSELERTGLAPDEVTWRGSWASAGGFSEEEAAQVASMLSEHLSKLTLPDDVALGAKALMGLGRRGPIYFRPSKDRHTVSLLDSQALSSFVKS